MTILVTGAFGYVGSVLMKHLYQAGCATKTCDRGWFTAASTSPAPSAQPDFKDFRLLTAEALDGIDTIIHLAAFSNDPLGSLDAAHTMSLNHSDVIRLAQTAKASGVGTFVFASSCSVYGTSGAAVVSESSATNPLTPYAKAKHLAEGDLIALHDDSFQVRILRGATAFGQSDCPRTDLLLNELCAEAALGRPLILQSDGTSWRPFMPVEDFAKALFTAATCAPEGDTKRPLWNIAPPGMQMTVTEAATRATKVAGLGAPVMSEGSGPDQRSYRVDGQAFTKAFPSFQYSEDFEAQIDRSISYFSTLPTLDADIAQKRFIRLASLNRDTI